MIVAILALAEVKIIQNENREIQPFMTAEDPLTVAQDQGASSKVSSKRISRDPTFHESRGTTTVAEDRGISSKDTSKQESRDPSRWTQ